jgi:hypothetical protein
MTAPLMWLQLAPSRIRRARVAPTTILALTILDDAATEDDSQGENNR